jgi:hypothetical protein
MMTRAGVDRLISDVGLGSAAAILNSTDAHQLDG